MTEKAARFVVGAARADISVWEPGHLMMGWADPRNVARSLGGPLEARAVAITDASGGATLVFVALELAIVTDALRDAVAARVSARTTLPASSLVLAATHNHSGPGGYAGYFWYDLPSGGFSSTVRDTLADRIAAAVCDALAARVPAEIRVVEGETELRAVARNRAVRAYNRNRTVTKVPLDRPELAVDPRMQLVRFDALDGRPLAMINWFGLHGTCHHGDGTVVRPDHKGVAASRFESTMPAGFVACFAQGAAGDVTSNDRFDPARGVNVGPGEDDEASCALVAAHEVEAARRLYDRAAQTAPLDGPLEVATAKVALAGRALDPKYTGGAARRTGDPEIALGMALGTDEGPGPLHPARRLQRALAVAVRARTRVVRRLGGRVPASPQVPMIRFHEGRRAVGFGFLPIVVPRVPDALARRLGPMGERALNGAPEHTRLVPREVDVTVVRLGRLALGTVAAEPTTEAYRRMRQSLGATLAERGVTEVVLSAYTNGYAGYLVTPEEHEEQGYESGASMFGALTLPLFQTVLDEVAAKLPALHRAHAAGEQAA